MKRSSSCGIVPTARRRNAVSFCWKQRSFCQHHVGGLWQHYRWHRGDWAVALRLADLEAMDWAQLPGSGGSRRGKDGRAGVTWWMVTDKWAQLASWRQEQGMRRRNHPCLQRRHGPPVSRGKKNATWKMLNISHFLLGAWSTSLIAN